MQTDVRAWYFGGVKTGVPTSSDTEEAYLLGPIDGASVEVTHHAAIDHWTSPQPVITQSVPLQNQGPIWIHPWLLQSIDQGDHWIGQEIGTSERSQGNIVSGGGVVDIHSQADSRYGPTVEMWVITNPTGPGNFKPQAYENYAVFGAIPQVTRIAHDEAGSFRPEQWAPFGDDGYLMVLSAKDPTFGLDVKPTDFNIQASCWAT